MAGLQCIQEWSRRTKERSVNKRNSTQSLQKNCLTIATTLGDKECDDRGRHRMGHHIKMQASGPWKVDVHAQVSSPIAHGVKTSFRYQGRCKECQKKTTWQCSDCNDSDKTVFLCTTKNGKRCFLDHIARNHAHLDDY